MRSKLKNEIRRGNSSGAVSCVRRWLRRVRGKELSGCVKILVRNLDAYATNRIGIEPVHLDEMLVLNVCGNACCLQPGAKEVRFLRLTECGDCFHKPFSNA